MEFFYIKKESSSSLFSEGCIFNFNVIELKKAVPDQPWGEDMRS
jgi:hypothetical protein